MQKRTKKDMKQKNKVACAHGDKMSNTMDFIETFLGHVETSPELIAIMTSDTSWTYQALFQEVLVWKQRLESLAIQGPVIVCLHRTPQLISVLLALQWLGVPYIPVETQTPLERLRAIVHESESEIMLHDTSHHQAFLDLPCNIYALSQLKKIAAGAKPKTASRASSAIAYIIYTSGTTGTPKGVRISRGALNNFLKSMSHYFLNEDQAVLLATTTLVFDIAALELYLPLWQRKTLFLANDDEHKEPLHLQALLEHYPITLLQGTPSFWRMLHYAGWRGKKDLVALCGGEPLTHETAKHMLSHVNSLWNMYGPTEATVWCALKQIKTLDTMTVGQPIHNLSMWILDEKMQVVPQGTQGELYIGGLGLADGYMNQIELTNERFVFYEPAEGSRLYRTGDRASMTDQSEFIIFGRMDNQIKLHGYRIELEDIEAHIEACSGVRESAVCVYQEQLVAYICLQHEANYAEHKLLEQLACELPTFMIPSRLIYLDTLPTNVSGKLNRQALPKPIAEKVTKGTPYASNDGDFLTRIEVDLLKIWRDTLGVTDLGLHDNFFELGGHSLLAARIIFKVQQKLGKQVKISDIYHAPSVAQLTECIHALPAVVQRKLQHKKSLFSSWIPLSDFQFTLWVSHLFDRKIKQLNVVGRRRIVGPLNRSALDLALQALVRKHDVLSYTVHRFFPVQKKKQKHAIEWTEHRFLDKNAQKMESYLHESMDELNNHQVWAKNKPMIRVKLIYLCGRRMEIQMAMPHVIADQQSLDVFFDDLSEAYLFYSRQSSAKIKLETKSFESYTSHEHHTIRSSLETDEVFWENYLKDVNLVRFPKRHVVSNPEKQGYTYSSFFEIEEKRLAAWRALCAKQGVTFSDLICASIALTLHGASDEVNLSEQLFINTVKSTREDPAYDEVIGCFLRTQPVKLDLSTEKNILALAKQAQQSALETEPHQYASTLMKLASLGALYENNRSIKSGMIALISLLLKRTSKHSYLLSQPILNACKRLTALGSQPGFVVNLNIWNSFLHEPQKKSDYLFGRSCEAVPLEEKDIFKINDVLDICFFRDTAQNKSFMVLSSNLVPEFREHLGEVLLDALES